MMFKSDTHMQRKVVGEVSDPAVTLVPITSDKGLCGAINTSIVRELKKMIIEEGEPARERYLTMLKSGSSDYPVALLKKAGIDMTSTAPIEATIAVFDDLVDQLEVALDEMNALAVNRQ